MVFYEPPDRMLTGSTALAVEAQALREENARLKERIVGLIAETDHLTRERDEARADLDLKDKEHERVYRANQSRIGELAAEVKRLEGLILDDERHMEALLATLGASKHPWITKVYRNAKGAWEARRIREGR